MYVMSVDSGITGVPQRALLSARSILVSDRFGRVSFFFIGAELFIVRDLQIWRAVLHYEC